MGDHGAAIQAVYRAAREWLDARAEYYGLDGTGGPGMGVGSSRRMVRAVEALEAAVRAARAAEAGGGSDG